MAQPKRTIDLSGAGSRVGIVVLLTVLAAAGFALSRRPPASTQDDVAGRSGEAHFDAQQQRAIDALRARLLQRGEPGAPEGSAGQASAEILVYLADTAEDPRIIEAALREIPTIYSSRSSRKPKPDAALERTLLKHVRSNDPSIADAALAASRVALMTKRPSAELANAIAELSAPERDSARRAAALDALNLIRPDGRGSAVLAAFEQALAATEPHLVSLALLALSQSGPSLSSLPQAERARLAQRLLALGAHHDPGVRGRSLSVLAEVEWLVAAEERFSTAVQHLDDEHPYVRGEAANLSFRCRQPMAIHVLVLRAGDLAPARYELGGWTRLDGAPGNLIHVVPGRERVAEAAQLALLALSENLPGVSPLTLTLGSRRQPDAVVLQNADIARAWYRREEADIPRHLLSPQ